MEITNSKIPCVEKIIRNLKIIILGFGMLESGCVSLKNEANIMMKNVVDVVLVNNFPSSSSTINLTFNKMLLV